MKTFALSATAALALLAGVTAAPAQGTTVTTTTGATGGTVTISPAEETEIHQYVTKEHWTSANVPSGTKVVVGSELPSSVELHTVPKVEKYKVAVVDGETVLVDPGTRKIVKIIKK